MTLLYKILLSYERLSKFSLFTLTLVRNEFANSSRSSVYGFWFYFQWLRTPNSRKEKRIQIRTLGHRGRQGFTLVELMVTVAVLAIIVSIATPAILNQLASMEAKRIKNQLESALRLAKAESLIRRQNVLVCLSNAAGRCDRDSDKILLLFIDSNGNNHFDAQVDFLLSQQTLNLKYGKLKLRVGNERHYTKFWGDSGTPRGHFGHIKYCPIATYSQAMYQISFNQTGIIKQKLNEDHPTECNK